MFVPNPASGVGRADTDVDLGFFFQPIPVISGPQLDADLAILRAFSERTFIPPSFSLWLFMGDAGKDLFLRRAATREARETFEAEFARRYPDVAGRTQAARTAVAAKTATDLSAACQRRISVPELIYDVALIKALPGDVSVVFQAPLPVPKRRGQILRCDCELRRRARAVRVEVAGMVNRRGPPPTRDGETYIGRWPARLAVYADAGLEPPLMVCADELCDPAQRAQAVGRALALL